MAALTVGIGLSGFDRMKAKAGLELLCLGFSLLTDLNGKSILDRIK
jgi:hypothetical protein